MSITITEINEMIEKYYVDMLMEIMSEDITYGCDSSIDTIFCGAEGVGGGFNITWFRNEIMESFHHNIEPTSLTPKCIWEIVKFLNDNEVYGAPEYNSWYDCGVDMISYYCSRWFDENIMSACAEMGDLCKFDKRIVYLEEMAENVFMYKYYHLSDCDDLYETYSFPHRERRDFASNIWRMGKKMAMKNALKNRLPIEMIDEIIVNCQE